MSTLESMTDEELALAYIDKLITKLRDGHYTNSGKFIWWATRIAHNVIIDHYRAVKSSKIVDQGEDNDLSNLRGNTPLDSNRESEMSNAQVMRDVKRLMNNLPETQREVVFMRFFQDLSFKEIAEQTNVSINTSLGRMRYALINMRRAYALRPDKHAETVETIWCQSRDRRLS